MYEFFVKILTAIISIDPIWKIIKPFANLLSLIPIKRRQVEEIRTVENSPIFPMLEKLEVMNGQFKGMKYPSLQAFRSSLYPKIIGSYESELNETIEQIRKKDYTMIIDIGCAEGYYAVGFGLMFPNAKIYGYDNVKKARDLCIEMGELNNIDERLEVRAECTSEDILNFKFDEKTLIICDCEGFEKRLFDKENAKNLTNVDLLIEVHDFIDINISGQLESLFSETHKIHKIRSIDDLDKAKNYKYEQTQNLDLETKKILFREGRPQLMEWLFCESRRLPEN